MSVVSLSLTWESSPTRAAGGGFHTHGRSPDSLHERLGEDRMVWAGFGLDGWACPEKEKKKKTIGSVHTHLARTHNTLVVPAVGDTRMHPVWGCCDRLLAATNMQL